MATPAMPPLNWNCPICRQTVPGGQPNCPNCAGAGAPATPASPRPTRSRPAPASASAPASTPATQPSAPAPAPIPTPRRTPATPPTPPPPPHAHGGNLQYQQNLSGVSVDRNENIINHKWYKFLLWILVLGGLALLAWLVYGGFLWGWHANPCKPPCVAAAAPAPPVKTAAHKSSPAPASKRSRPAISAAPQQVQLSGSVDLVHHEGQQTQIATPPAPARRLTPEELDEATTRWLEGQRDP